jgi:hypothetical protein
LGASAKTAIASAAAVSTPTFFIFSPSAWRDRTLLVPADNSNEHRGGCHGDVKASAEVDGEFGRFTGRAAPAFGLANIAILSLMLVNASD